MVLLVIEIDFLLDNLRLVRGLMEQVMLNHDDLNLMMVVMHLMNAIDENPKHKRYYRCFRSLNNVHWDTILIHILLDDVVEI